jgi:hypothetical protein
MTTTEMAQQPLPSCTGLKVQCFTNITGHSTTGVPQTDSFQSNWM